MGKITNPIEVFGTSTLPRSPWMALEPTLFKQVYADQSKMLDIAFENIRQLVGGLVAVLLNMLEDPRS